MKMMVKIGKKIAKWKWFFFLLAIVLLVPAGIGISRTKVNYDILSYLPEDLETVKGQEIMVDQFGTGAFSMVVVEDMPLKNVAALKEKIEGIDHV